MAGVRCQTGISQPRSLGAVAFQGWLLATKRKPPIRLNGRLLRTGLTDHGQPNRCHGTDIAEGQWPKAMIAPADKPAGKLSSQSREQKLRHFEAGIRLRSFCQFLTWSKCIWTTGLTFWA